MDLVPEQVRLPLAGALARAAKQLQSVRFHGLAWGNEEILEVIVRERPDVALVDIGLPGMDGYELAQSVRRELAGAVKLVALTGYGQPTDVSRSTQAGFDRHVTKPLATDKLELILRELMGG